MPSPHGYGWKVKDDEITIDWMDQQPAPLELLETVSCGCRRGCTSGRCSCSKASLACTDACKCSGCGNWPEKDAEGACEDIGEDDGSGSESDDDEPM